MNKFFYTSIKMLVIIFLLCFCVVGFLFYHYSKDLPDYSELAHYHPSSVTRLYSSDGKLIEEYARERRIFIPIESMPRSLIEAFVSAEDKNYYTHPGVDILGIIRAIFVNINNLIKNKRMEGGSTITQQVVRSFFLSSERSLERKIKEAILSYMVSKVFTKNQILEIYLNQIYLGKGAYGVAIAAQNYFDKSIDELDIAESAFIAGLPKAPSNFDPEKNYDRVKERRDYVINRMQEDGYITKDVADNAIKSPIKLKQKGFSNTVKAYYYAEKVREEAIKIVGHDYFYTGGLTVITGLDSKKQSAAKQALIKGIREYDKKRGWRKPITNIANLDNWQIELKKVQNPQGLLEYEIAVVLEVTENTAKIGLQNGTITKIFLKDMKWTKTGLSSVKNLLSKGDVVVVSKNQNMYLLEQIPEVNGAILVIDHRNGRVLADQGGYDFSSSKFDRVSQAQRQPGSLSKPFVYLAALENNIPPNKIFEDAPIEINQGAGMPVWRPKNYKGDFLGRITMRTGLEKSRNLITVRIANAVGLDKVSDMIKRFGINDNPKQVYSMVLGSIETTLIRMSAAFGAIANQGKKLEPHFIELIRDRNGKIIYKYDETICNHCLVEDANLKNPQTPSFENTKKPIQVVDEATDYQITSMLQGVIERGTGQAAKKLGKIIAGKTGTSNDSKDTWFIGFTPKIVVGTYVGYDLPKTLGKSANGASIALPIFIDFMQNGDSDTPSIAFQTPNSIELRDVNQFTGEYQAGAHSIKEAFKNLRANHDAFSIIEPDSENHGSAEHNHDKNTQEDNSSELY